MFEGRRAELRSRSTPTILCAVDQPQRALALLQTKGFRAMLEGNQLRIVPHEGVEPAEVNSILVNAGFAVSELLTTHPTLEEFFLELTSTGVEKEYATQ
jgi:hypothetical protein